ncbi:unnamed protein product [Litomosoides sigmodontis]|uniref:Fucosyltransferase n=1 Tax=Litomosoides sigmodontis TaxID=42156 RepID=A0A3P6U5F5_LITSI|nr:unnamed protein product [Litomosoides sigmodontis]
MSIDKLIKDISDNCSVQLCLLLSFVIVQFKKQKTEGDRTPLRQPLILTWTQFFSQSWAQRIQQELNSCAYHCAVTDDKEQLSEATAVLFHIRDMNELPELRYSKQLFVFVLHESPQYTFNYLDHVAADFFNLTMTYRSKRELYVNELRKYINVTQHGRCSNSICDEECEVHEAAQHRFYLAFENSICRDYITEKLFKSFRRLLVPVVLKNSIYEGILPPESYIAADDFTSPRELAQYLTRLSTNDTAYLRYFEWTKNYEKTFDVSVYCELCKYLHRDNATSHENMDIKKWWFQGCFPDYAEDLLKRGKSATKGG